MSTEALTATKNERKSIMEILPLIAEIKDETLRDLVIETWARIWRESPYRDLHDVLNNPTAIGGNEKLVEHTNKVGKIVLGMAIALEEVYGVIVDRDVLIADVVLHDVDKMVMLERKGDKCEGTTLSKKILHGHYGALVAFKVGVPREIVATVLNHSPFASKVDPDTVEGVLLRHGDLTAIQGYRVASGLPLLPGI